MIMNRMNEYEQLDENLLYEFPRNIIVDTRVKFAKYSLPTICNGIKVVEDDIQLRQKRRRKVYSIPDPNEEKVKSELDLLKYQVHPHFLFNMLNKILPSIVSVAIIPAENINPINTAAIIPPCCEAA